MRNFYQWGCNNAIKSVGEMQPMRVQWVVKIAAVEETGLSNLQIGSMGAAAAAPFTGLIGQQKIIHDPMRGATAPSAKSFSKLQRMAREGDVLVTTKPEGSLWKKFISPLAGTEFYHAQPVVGRRRGQGLTASAGEFADKSYAKATPSQLRVDTDTIDRAFKGEYTDALLLRPKNLSKQQLKAVADNALRRTAKDYDTGRATKVWLNDIFMPKIKGLENIGQQVICEGNVCSTVPAQALTEETGRAVVPGKAAKNVMPPDFLRSKEYELVGKYLNTARYKRSPAMRKALPYLVRSGIGAGLAGLTYGISEDPALAAGVTGGLGGLAGGTALARRKASRGFVEPFGAVSALLSKTEKGRSKLLKAFAKKNLPLLLGTGALAYGGAKGLEYLLTKQKPE